MNYLNGKPTLEILGQPKTVRMRGRFPMANGKVADLEGPLECWIAALVQSLPPEQKAVFAAKLQRALEVREHQAAPARVVADIEMPRMNA